MAAGTLAVTIAIRQNSHSQPLPSPEGDARSPSTRIIIVGAHLVRHSRGKCEWTAVTVANLHCATVTALDCVGAWTG
jgi:hypothetical protein